MIAWRNKVAPRLDTLLPVLIASAALTVVRAGNASNPHALAACAIGELMVLLAVTWVLCRRAGSVMRLKGFMTITVCAAAVYPFVAESTLRQFAGGSEPLEMLLLRSLQFTALVLAVFSSLPQAGSLAVLLSSFMLLFVVTMTSSGIMLAIAGLFGTLVLWWLMSAYWNRLAGAFAASKVERRVPMRVLVIAGTGLVLLLVATILSQTYAGAIALHGVMPTSGGTRWHDPHARSGMGDGDAIVAARDEAMSFGPVESELFLDSEMPSLYDTVSELYGDPPKPKRHQQRNIAIAPDEVKETEQRIAQTERSGREFSAVRRKIERNTQTMDDRKAAAMLYVVGRVPLHLALERYDKFNGREWTHSGETESRPPIRLDTQHKKPWAHLMHVGSSSIHRGIEAHAVKIINLKTNRFPSPPQLTAVHLDKVDQPDFFGWSEDGVACMPVRDHIPQLTVVHLRSQGVNLEPLRRTETSKWRDVEAIVARLRSEFVLDPSAAAPEDCSDVVAHFLRVKRGPDYLFATTAAVLLRELGYETRLVTGFYARADRFDHRAGQTSVLAEDVHVWVEARVSGTTWVAIEPTPGYEPPRESLTWQQWTSMALLHCVAWFGKHISSILTALALVVLLIITRRAWLDALAVGVCRMMGLRSARARLLWTIRLLEWRTWLAGRSRPRRSTIAAWYGPLVDQAPADAKTPLTRFLYWTDRLLYAPDGIDPAEHAAIDTACRSVESVCTRKLLTTNVGP